MFSVRFFRTASGNEPVREWLRSLEPEERRVIGFDLRTVERGFPIGMPQSELSLASLRKRSFESGR